MCFQGPFTKNKWDSNGFDKLRRGWGAEIGEGAEFKLYVYIMQQVKEIYSMSLITKAAGRKF